VPEPEAEEQQLAHQPQTEAATVGELQLALRRGRPALWEWIFVGALSVICMAYWILHFHQFLIPSSDTREFAQLARELWDLQAPSYYKRMPLFPLLMGLVAKVVFSETPCLDAALVLNVIFSAGTLVLLYLFAREMTGWAAVLPLLFVAASKLTHNMAGQALVEPIMACAVLGCLLLFQRESKWQYLALFFAALTRYECAGLIATFFVANWVAERRFWKHLMLSAAASSGFLLWMLFSFLHHRGQSTNPYVEQMQYQGWRLGLDFIWRVVEASLHQRRGAILLVPALAGVVMSWWKCRRLSAVVLAFALLYVGAHVAFGVNRGRYVYPILWVLPLYLGVAASALLEAVSRRLGDRWRPLHSRLIAAAAMLVAGASIAISCRGVWKARGAAAPAVYIIFAIALLVLAAGYGGALVPRPRWAGVALGLGILAIAAPRVGAEVPAHASDSAKIRYRRWGSFMAGKWLARNMKPGEKALAFHTREVERGASLEYGRILNVAGMKAGSPVELSRELREKKVSYVICTHYRIPDESDVRHPILVRRYRPELMAAFKTGDEVPGFELVATIAAPPVAERETAYVYRVLPQPAQEAPERD
jgi:hypothetical protein